MTLEEVVRYKREARKTKLICSIDKEATASPEPIEVSQTLCVDGSLNSVQLRTEYTGEVTLIGPGAGGHPTATAILNDLLSIEKKERYANGPLTAEITRIRVQ